MRGVIGLEGEEENDLKCMREEGKGITYKWEEETINEDGVA